MSKFDQTGYCKQLPDGNWELHEDEEIASQKGYLESASIFSEKDYDNASYRYRLWRVWDPKLPRLAYVMLNSSRGTHFRLTPASKFCDKVAKQGIRIGDKVYQFGSIDVVNLFAFILSKSDKLLKVKGDIIGPYYDYYVRNVLEKAQTLIIAWGNKGSIQNRDKDILKLIKNMEYSPYCFEITEKNFPYHISGILWRQKMLKGLQDYDGLFTLKPYRY